MINHLKESQIKIKNQQQNANSLKTKEHRNDESTGTVNSTNTKQKKAAQVLY